MLAARGVDLCSYTQLVDGRSVELSAAQLALFCLGVWTSLHVALPYPQ